MRTVPLLAVLALSTGLFAQAPATGPVILLQTPVSQGCPVGLSAKHSPDGGMVQVSPADKPHPQGYSITFTPENTRGIAQAEITLHGMSGRHVVPAGAETGVAPKADAAESFTVAPSLAPNHLFQSVVYLHKLTGVQWIEIDELTFADGTHWHESAKSFCRVTPNDYMLVAGGR